MKHLLYRILLLLTLTLPLLALSLAGRAQLLTSISPTSGPVGTSVTLGGMFLSGVSAVYFNGTPATTFSTGPTSSAGIETLTVTVPAGASTGNVTVTKPGGTSNRLWFTVLAPPPTLTGFAPGSGPLDASVTVTGTHLADATSLLVGAVPARLTGQSATQFTFRVPRQAVGQPLRVSSPAGTALSAAAFAVTRPNPSPLFAGANLTTNGTTALDVGNSATPAVTDVDGNGRLDLLVGNSFGNVLRYEQTGPPTLTSLSPGSGAAGTSITLTGTNLTGATTVTFAGPAAGAFTVVNALTVTVPAGASTGNVTVTTPAGTSNGLSFTVYSDLVVSTSGQTIAAGTYHSITGTGTGTGTLAGPVTVTATTTVQSGGTLNDSCAILSGPGSFTLQTGGTLGICAAAGISSSGSTGSIQVTGTRSFSTDALYTYQGSAAQVTGTGLPAIVRGLTLANSAGLTLTGPVTVTAAATLSTGVLTTGPNALTLGSAATLSETAAGYATGTVQATRPLTTAGTTEAFGGLALTPGGSTLPGSTLVRRTTGTARTGAGTSQSVKRVFDIQPTVNTGLNVALTLTVRDDERNTIPVANLRLFKSEDAGSTWQRQAAATFATTAASGSQPTTYTASLAGISSFSLWTLGNAANPLPVELAAFTAQAQGTGALLRWTTASEINSQQFEVESSADGAHFARLGTVAGAGSSAPSAHVYLHR